VGKVTSGKSQVAGGEGVRGGPALFSATFSCLDRFQTGFLNGGTPGSVQRRLLIHDPPQQPADQPGDHHPRR